MGVAARVGAVPEGTRRDAFRARLRSVPLVAHRAHRRGDRIGRHDVAHAEQSDSRPRRVAPLPRRGGTRGGGPHLRIRAPRPRHADGRDRDPRTWVGSVRPIDYSYGTFGGGVIGNTTG